MLLFNVFSISMKGAVVVEFKVISIKHHDFEPIMGHRVPVELFVSKDDHPLGGYCDFLTV
jgi:hypothetical protein